MWRTRSRRHFRAWFLDSGLRRNDDRIGPRSPLRALRRGAASSSRRRPRLHPSQGAHPSTRPHRHPSPRPGRARRRRACLQEAPAKGAPGTRFVAPAKAGSSPRPRRHPRDHRHHAPQATRRPKPCARRAPAPIDTAPPPSFTPPGRARRRRAWPQDTIRRPGEGRGPVRRPRRQPRATTGTTPRKRPGAPKRRAPAGHRARPSTRPTAILHPAPVERAGEGHGFRTRFVARRRPGPVRRPRRHPRATTGTTPSSDPAPLPCARWHARAHRHAPPPSFTLSRSSAPAKGMASGHDSSPRRRPDPVRRPRRQPRATTGTTPRKRPGALPCARRAHAPHRHTPHRHPSPRPGRARRRRAWPQDTIRRPGEGRSSPAPAPATTLDHPHHHTHQTQQRTHLPPLAPAHVEPINRRPAAILRPALEQRAGPAAGQLDARRSLRKLPGRLLLLPLAPARAGGGDLCLRPFGRRHCRRRRRAAAGAPRPAQRLPPRTAPHRAGQDAPIRCLLGSPPTSAPSICRCSSSATCSTPSARMSARPATPTSTNSSTTAAARPTRSAACCCASTAPTGPRTCAA